MKKNFLFILIMTMAVLTVACGKKKQTNEKETTTVDLTSKVEITVSKDFYGDVTSEGIMESAKAQGFLNTQIDASGNVTYTMTEEVRQKMLKMYTGSIDKEISRMLEGSAKVESFSSIKYNNNYTELSVYVDGAKFTRGEENKCEAILFNGAAYQAFSGVEAGSINITLKVIDASTKKVIMTATYDNKLNLTSK